MATSPLREDEKIDAHLGEVDHVETGHHTKTEAVDNAYAHGQVESGYESLTILQTIKQFKMACLVCGLATFAAATDGYQSEYRLSGPLLYADCFSRYQR